MRTNTDNYPHSSYNSIGNVLLQTITAALMASFVIFEQSARGKYLFLGLIILFFIVYAVYSGLRIPLTVDRYHFYTALFALFCVCSMIWASSPRLTYNRMTTVVETVLFMWVLYLYYRDLGTVTGLLNILCSVGIIVASFAIFRYGFSTIRSIISMGDRAGNSFSNINTIGMMSAISVLIVFFRLLNKKFSLTMLLAAPCVLMVIASGSRKAFSLILAGIMMLVILQAVKKSRSPGTALLKVVIAIVLFAIIARIVLSLPFMKSLTEPLRRLMNYFTGEGASDESVRRRMKYISLGLHQFLQTPILGIGIGNSALLIGRASYLHNNYVELLACGGVVGFLIYYAPYAYLTRCMIHYRWVEQEENNTFCFVLLLLILLMDFGQVSYFSKETYFYLLILFTHVNTMKRQTSSMGSEADRLRLK